MTLTLRQQLLLTSRFPGLMSRWSTWAECRYLSPVNNNNKFNFFFFKYLLIFILSTLLIFVMFILLRYTRTCTEREVTNKAVLTHPYPNRILTYFTMNTQTVKNRNYYVTRICCLNIWLAHLLYKIMDSSVWIHNFSIRY